MFKSFHEHVGRKHHKTSLPLKEKPRKYAKCNAKLAEPNTNLQNTLPTIVKVLSQQLEEMLPPRRLTKPVERGSHLPASIPGPSLGAHGRSREVDSRAPVVGSGPGPRDEIQRRLTLLQGI